MQGGAAVFTKELFGQRLQMLRQARGEKQEELGAVIGVKLNFLQLIGWFILALYIINELTSILENMVALGVDVPEFLIRGLAAVKTAVDEAGDRVIPQTEDEDDEETHKE